MRNLHEHAPRDTHNTYRIAWIWFVVAWAIAFVGPLGHTAGGATSFQAIAAAEGTRITITASGAPLSDQVTDVGAPAAQATIESLGTSRAFASLPYPGATAVGAPGLVAGATGGEVTPPTYPAYVASDHPVQPDEEQVAPGYALRASSDDQQSRASATTGLLSSLGGAGRTSAEALVETGGGTVISRSTSHLEAIRVGPLTVASIRSSATARLLPDGDVETASKLEVTSASVDGIAVAIDETGVVAAEEASGPASATVDRTLAEQGIVVEILAAEVTREGVVAPILRITVSGVEVPGVGPSEVAYSLGGSMAHIAGSSSAEPVAPAAGPSATPAPPRETAPGKSVSVSPVQGSAVPAAPMTSEARPPAAVPDVLNPTGLVRGPLIDWTSSYFVLVLMSFSTVIFCQAARTKGVRLS